MIKNDKWIIKQAEPKNKPMIDPFEPNSVGSSSER